MFRLSVRRQIGGLINRIILKNKLFWNLDKLIEAFCPLYLHRNGRRYKSFIGNYLITSDKLNLISFFIPTLDNLKNVSDIGSADGSLLLTLSRRLKQAKLSGFDSGYSLAGKRSRGGADVFFYDLDLRHKYYNPSGKNNPDEFQLGLEKNQDLILMFDVIPYLTNATLNNYFLQISNSLREGGYFFCTAQLAPWLNIERSGAGGEQYQNIISLEELLETTNCYSLRLEKFVYGGWSFSKSETVVYGADVLLFRKLSNLHEKR
jgi:hypothetical protein